MNGKEDYFEISSPGRLCLMGEHSDWAAEYGLYPGFCIVVGTDQGMVATAKQNDLFVVNTLLSDDSGRYSGRTRQMSCIWKQDALLNAAKDETEFFRYCAGVAYEVQKRFGITTSVEIQIKDIDIPLKKGVSSSAAVCILVAKAFDAVYELSLFPHELMELAYAGERLTGSQCGRMDQACIYGNTPVLLTFQKSKEPRIEPISCDGDIHIFFVDLAGHKDTMQILGDLNEHYLSSKDLQFALGKKNEETVRRAFRAISKGDSERLGALMIEAQDNFDRLIAPHSPDNLASPLLHQLLDFNGISDCVFGGKGVGSQGDGTAQFVARSQSARETAIAKIEESFPRMRCYPLNIMGDRIESINSSYANKSKQLHTYVTP